MTFDEYQKQALKTDVLGNGTANSILDPQYIAKVLGLAGESGEVVDKFKKIIRDKQSIISEADKVEIVKELGDVLWYVAVIASYLDTSFQAVADANIAKLDSRKNRGIISGHGDNR